MTATKVLIADDEDGWCTILKHLFESQGCVVDTASSYQGVREFLDFASFPYTLIVSDNNMPPIKKAGIELMAFAHLHPLHKKTPFVLHTSDDSDEVKVIVKKLDGIYRCKSDPELGKFLTELLTKQKAT